MSIFACASDEQFLRELKEGNEEDYRDYLETVATDEMEVLVVDSSASWSPCDDCELTYINQCSCCRFASPAINDSLNYKDDEDW